MSPGRIDHRDGWVFVVSTGLDTRSSLRGSSDRCLSLSHFGELIVMESHVVAEGGIDPDVARH